MTWRMQRPSDTFSANPAAGLLHAEHFQMAYATNDIDRACKLFQEQFGIREFRRLEGPLHSGGHIRVELAWVGSIMYELLTASGPGADLYIGRLPEQDFSVRHHHLGFLIQNENQWQGLMENATAQNWDMPHKSHNPGFMRSCFVDVPALGHYCEYIFPEQAGLDFFESVPGN